MTDRQLIAHSAQPNPILSHLERPLHTLRHSYARPLRRVEAPLEAVQAALDHSSLATLGACLATVRSATLAELAEATGMTIWHVRLVLRRLADQLEPAGMQVLDDGSHVQLAAERRFHGAVAHLLRPEQPPRLTPEQAEVLATVISDGMATRRRIEEVRGAAQLSIGREGPVTLPRASSETLALLLSRGLLCAERDDHSTGRPLVYQPTPRLLQLLGVETLEEARGRMEVPADHGSLS